MPMFRVVLHRCARESYDGRPQPNPFLAGLPPDGKTVRMLVREWEFEAEDEAEVRRLLQEAYEQDLPNVRGFSLRQITRLPVPQLEKHDPSCNPIARAEHRPRGGERPR